MAARSPAYLRAVRFRVLPALVLAAAIITVGAAPASATFAGPNGRISFNGFVERTKSIEIFTANPNGGDVRQLTSIPQTGSELPDWSPDGQRIAFFTERLNRDEPVQIQVMNADGSGVTQLTTGPGFHGFPSWSPDAASLAIATDWGNYPALRGIWIIPASDPDGVTQQEARRLTTLPAGSRIEDAEPQFSPDGSLIVFTRFKSPRKSAIHRVGIDGSGLQRLTPWRLNASDPDWSPNGRKIAFDSGDFNGQTDGGGDIYVMRADGSGRKRLTDFPRLRQKCCPPGFPGLANNPVWSPSGTRIMFTHFLPPPKGSKLVAMKPNGSGKHVVVGGRFGRRHAPNKVDWGIHP
jgi:Tol biopolymer transport system component